MDERESGRALIDDVLDRELEHALAVDPSPAFVARVRTRISSEPEPAWWRSRWIFGVAGVAAVAIVIVAVVVSRPERLAGSRVESTGAQSSVPADAGSPRTRPAEPEVLDFSPAVQPARPARAVVARPPVSDTPSASASMPDIIIAADEAAAFRQLISDVRLGRLDLASVPERLSITVALQPPNEITIAPLTLEPLERPATGEGERQ